MLADIRLSRTSGSGAANVLSGDCFWWAAARGETRGLILAAWSAGQAWILGSRAVDVDGFGGICEQIRADCRQVLH